MKRGIIVGLACMLFCISGCGGVQEDIPSGSSVENTQEHEKEIVTIGKIDGAIYEHTYTQLQVYVDAFNTWSEDYQIEFSVYDEELDLKLALLRGEGPDLFDFGSGGVDISILANKGVLQDLSSFFADSDVIKEEDLVDSIHRAGTINDHLVCIFPNFMVQGMMVTEESLAGDIWSLEKYISLGEEHSDAVMKDGGDPSIYKSLVLRDAMYANMDQYIDFPAGNCSFDSQEFVSLVVRVQELPKMLGTDMGSVYTYDLSAVMDKFLDGKIMTYPFTCSGLEGYITCTRDEELGDIAVELVGYPRMDGEPYYSLYCKTPLGMNAASENKDGAWAFLEFLLSRESQESDWMENFPVRKDSFLEELEKTEGHRGFGEIDLSEEEREFVKYMVDNAYWFDAGSAKDVWYIISEELQPVWIGQKSVEDAVKIIQSRISLLVSE